MDCAPDVMAVGPAAALVELDDGAAALALAAWARSHVPGGTEVVPGARTVLLDGVTLEEATALVARWAGSIDQPSGPLVTLRTSYDGPDLDRVAGHWQCSVAEVVERHRSTTFTSAFVGFSPGFAYLGGLPADLRVPRLSSPRPSVPAGAVALADGWCGVYPSESPGGWLLIGSVDERLWDVRRDQPALLAPGTRVRFVPR